MAIKAAAASHDPHAMLDGMTVAQLTALIKAAEQKRTAEMDDARQGLIKEMTDRAEELGLSLEDLLPRQAAAQNTSSRATQKVSEVSHRLPSGATRKARGKRSAAYTAELEDLKGQGRSEDEFRIG